MSLMVYTTSSRVWPVYGTHRSICMTLLEFCRSLSFTKLHRLFSLDEFIFKSGSPETADTALVLRKLSKWDKPGYDISSLTTSSTLMC